MTVPLRTVLVGCGRMGQNQANIIAGLPEFKLLGVSDINPDNAQAAARATGATAYADFDAMLAEQKPDVVAICTANDTHAKYTLASVRSPGVRGIYCEKPMATNLADARAMVAACRDKKIPLVINHQRRIGADLIEARRLMESKAIGSVQFIRGQCAGDLLSDGTHLIDSMLFLTGDTPIEWVLGQVHRVVDPAQTGSGWRFGHLIETGALGILHFSSGVRAEILCGDIRDPNSLYHDIQIFGNAGRIWRKGDKWPNLDLQDAASGRWRAVPIPEPKAYYIVDGYRLFADAIHTGAVHPMNGDVALHGFEALMALYESARLRRKITLPLQQDRFPLELMVEAGQL